MTNRDPVRPTVHDTHDHTPHVGLRTYYLVFAALMVLLIVTVGAAFIPITHGRFAWLGIGIAMLIAVVKATLVVLYFMHVKDNSALTKVFVAAGLMWLFIMFTFTFADYNTRDGSPMSQGWDENPVRPGRDIAGAGARPAPRH